MNKYLDGIKVEIFLEVVCSLGESLALAGIAYIPKLIFDGMSTEVNLKNIIVVVMIYCILALISVITAYFSMLFNWKFAVKFENLIKVDYFNSLINYDDMEFNKKDVSEYISIQSNDIMQIEQII